jgi:hypothetical protein
MVIIPSTAIDWVDLLEFTPAPLQSLHGSCTIHKTGTRGEAASVHGTSGSCSGRLSSAHHESGARWYGAWNGVVWDSALLFSFVRCSVNRRLPEADER